MVNPINLNEIPVEIMKYVGNIHSITFPRQGYSSNVGIIECDSGKFALKRTKGEKDNAQLRKEVTRLRSLKFQTDLSVPKVHLFEEQSTQKECWALLQFFEGETIRTALLNEQNKTKRHEILFHFGEALAKIHATPCPTEIKAKDQWLNNMLIQAAYNLENFEVDGNEILLNQITSTPLQIERQKLIHGDFTIDNVLIQDGLVTGIIDWGSAAFGDPRFDVALAIRPKPYAFQEAIDKEIFFEGYGENVIDEKSYDYYVNGLYEFF